MSTGLENQTVLSGQEDDRARNVTSKHADEMYERSLPLDLKCWATTTPDALIVVNRHFQIRGLNKAACAMLGRSSQEAIGQRCQKILHCCDQNHLSLCGTPKCPLAQTIEKKEPLSYEELLVGPISEPGREVCASVTPTTVGKKTSIVFSLRDVSALMAANRIRANFVSMVSHELRTPLNSVHGFIDLLLQGNMGKLSEEQQMYLGYAQEGMQQLISIVEDILFMTRSDAGQFVMRRQEVNLGILIRQVVNSMKPQALKASITIDKDIPTPSPLIYADPQRIQQVLNNLVANAIKFTPPDGKVTIRVRQDDEQFAIISVTDTGYGISPRDRPHIFERFYQADNKQQSKVGGYGLGLSIARLIIEQHDGTINFDSAINTGTTFYFTVPLYKE